MSRRFPDADGMVPSWAVVDALRERDRIERAAEAAAEARRRRVEAWRARVRAKFVALGIVPAR